MVQAGTDDDGSPIFVGRAFFQNDLLPAKVIPSKNAAYVCHNGGEHFVDEFDVLMTVTYVWRAGAHGSVPIGAVTVGNTSDGEPLYMGRAHYQGTLTPGKVRKWDFELERRTGIEQFFLFRFIQHIVVCTCRLGVKKSVFLSMKFCVQNE
jgi:Protein of unknown function (DUF3421)